MLFENRVLIRIAKILKPHGLKGELKVLPYNDYSHPKKFLEYNFFYCQSIKQSKPTLESKVLNLKHQKKLQKFFILTFSEINSIEEAETYRNRGLFVDKKDLKLPPKDEVGGSVERGWLIDDLIGVEVVDEISGEVLGIIDSYYAGGGGEGLYQVNVTNFNLKERLSRSLTEFLIPSELAMFKELDIAKKKTMLTELDLYWW